ncbi:hypothetical protein HMPREF9997_02005, partial [Corynebacterium durum F0235]
MTIHNIKVNQRSPYIALGASHHEQNCTRHRRIIRHRRRNRPHTP